MRFGLVNIESKDGTSRGIKITDAATGAEIPGVVEADVAIRPDAPIEVRLTIAFIKAKLQGVPTFWIYDPRGGAQKRVAKIVFADGQEFEPGAD